jgi:hypothetical protein
MTPRSRPSGAMEGGHREEALLAMPEPTRTGAQRREAERVQREMERSAAIAVCGHALRHGDSREQVLEDLFELGLLPDPLVVQRYHFGAAVKEDGG